jgi:hypothetical protein
MSQSQSQSMSMGMGMGGGGFPGSYGGGWMGMTGSMSMSSAWVGALGNGFGYRG